jgi:hypothetical protein
MQRVVAVFVVFLASSLDLVFSQVASSKPKGADGSSSQAASEISVNLPQTMRFCGSRCFILTMRDGRYYDAIGEGGLGWNVESRYTIVQFTPDAISLKRVDTTGASAVVTGKISSQGNSIVDGVMEFHMPDGRVFPAAYQLSWGTALALARPAGSQQGSSQANSSKTGTIIGDIFLEGLKTLKKKMCGYPLEHRRTLQTFQQHIAPSYSPNILFCPVRPNCHVTVQRT